MGQKNINLQNIEFPQESEQGDGGQDHTASLSGKG